MSVHNFQEYAGAPRPAFARLLERRGARRLLLRTALFAVLCVTLVAHTQAAEAQAEPTQTESTQRQNTGVNTYAGTAPTTTASVDLTTVAQAYQLRNARGGVLVRRSVVQRLGLTTNPSFQWSGTVSTSLRFDQGLPLNPTDPEQADRQLEAAIHMAFVTHRPFDALTLRYGRFVQYDALGFSVVDGASMRLVVDSITITAATGLRPNLTSLSINDDSFAPDSDIEFRREASHQSWLNTLSTAVTAGPMRFGFGVADERAPLAAAPGTVRYRTAVAVSAESDHDGRANAQGSVRYETLQQTIERARIRTSYRLDTISLAVTGTLAHTVFPTDSVFSVYPSAPRFDLSAGVSSAGPVGPRWELAWVQRFRGSDDHALPFGDAMLRHQYGFRLRLNDVRPHERVVFGAAMTPLYAQSDDWRIDASVSGVMRTHESGPDIRLDLHAINFRDPRFDDGGTAHGIFATTGLSARLGWWADVQASMTVGGDSRNGTSLRTDLLVDLRLPGPRDDR